MSSDENANEALAREMFAQTLENGHSARRVGTDDQGAAVRGLVRRLGRSARVRLRTAQLDGVVLVARLDAAIWNDDPQTMRAKLTPPM